MLDCDVLAILGMDFFTQVNPKIDWEKHEMRVKVGSRKVHIRLKEFSRSGSDVVKVVEGT